MNVGIYVVHDQYVSYIYRTSLALESLYSVLRRQYKYTKYEFNPSARPLDTFETFQKMAKKRYSLLKRSKPFQS